MGGRGSYLSCKIEIGKCVHRISLPSDWRHIGVRLLLSVGNPYY